MPEYEQVLKTFKLPTGVNRIQVRLTVDDKDSVVYFDDISLVPLMSYSASPTTTEPLSDSYSTGAWGTAASGSVELFGDEYSIAITSGVDISPQLGSFACRYIPLFSGTLMPGLHNIMVLSGYGDAGYENVARLYYNGDSRRFGAQIWDNSGEKWIASGLESDWQESWNSGTAIDLALTWDCRSNCSLYVSGVLAAFYDGSWEAGILPPSIFLGGVSGNIDEGSCLGRLDSVQLFTTYITETLAAVMHEERFPND